MGFLKMCVKNFFSLFVVVGCIIIGVLSTISLASWMWVNIHPVAALSLIMVMGAAISVYNMDKLEQL